MRILGTFETEKAGKTFSALLTENKIPNLCEIILNRDWDSPHYGTPMSKIWVYDEDLVEQAQQLLDEYRRDPDNPRFLPSGKTPPLIAPEPDTEEQPKIKLDIPTQELKNKAAKASMGKITFYLIMICIWLFIWSAFTSPAVSSIPIGFPPTPLVASQVDKELFYDYPHAYELVDRIVKLFGVEKLYNPDELPREGRLLVEDYLNTPFWQGFYKKIVKFVKTGTPDFAIDAPLFEKAREGEIWRFWSPCLLHSDIFHILFNMFWLAILGTQLETRMQPFRYILFILITGIFSNTAQYLMSGANFIGISGVLCAMLAFIWVRQKKAPWEGYQLQPGTIGLITFFVLAMAGIQFISFISEAYFDKVFTPGVANTAHLSGAFIGYLLGRLNFFSWKSL